MVKDSLTDKAASTHGTARLSQFGVHVGGYVKVPFSTPRKISAIKNFDPCDFSINAPGTAYRMAASIVYISPKLTDQS